MRLLVKADAFIYMYDARCHEMWSRCIEYSSNNFDGYFII